MTRRKRDIFLGGLMAFGFPVILADAQPALAPRSIGLSDILAWRRISSPTASADGRWFAFRVAPAEGDGEVVFRQTRGGIAYRFPAGEGGSGVVAFSEDARYGAFLAPPGSEEARRLRKEGKPLSRTAWVVNLASGEKTAFAKVRALSFPAGNPAWLALHKESPDTMPRGQDGGSGSDLVLRELATGKDLVIGNVTEFAFDAEGGRLAMLIDAAGMSGNGLFLRTMAGGVIAPLDTDRAIYQSLSWSAKGTALVCLKGRPEPGSDDKWYSVLGFTGLASGEPRRIEYDPRRDRGFPSGWGVSPYRGPAWTEGLEALLFGIAPRRSPAGSAASTADDDLPDLVLWHGRDPRLQPQQAFEANRDRAFSYLSEYRIAERKLIRLADGDIRRVDPAPRGRFAIGRDSRAYELDGSLTGRYYQDVYVIDMRTGSRRLVLKKNEWIFSPSPDGTRFLFFDDGVYFAYDMAAGAIRSLTRATPANFINEDDDHNLGTPPDFPIGWARDSRSVLLSDGWDVWSVPVDGSPGVNLTADGRKEGIRYRPAESPNQEDAGWDLSRPLIFATYGEWTKKAGFSEAGKGFRRPRVLIWEDALFGPLLKAKNAEAYFFTRETPRDYPDWYTAGRTLENASRLTEANPRQKCSLWSGTRGFNGRPVKKPVIMLPYEGENHWLARPANQKDYTSRMK